MSAPARNRNASCSTQSPIVSARSESSETERNSPGSTSPRSGCAHRSRASAPTICESARRTIGWKCNLSSPRSTALCRACSVSRRRTMSARALSSNTRTHARPADFASYIAMSALRRMISADSLACSANAMPTLAVMRSSRPAISNGAAHAASTCWATILAPARSTPSHTTTNSSPPSRATGSEALTAPTRRRATATSNASPTP